MIHASCHCGAVRLEIRRKPRTLTECNCSICGRLAARWAYYSAKSVRVLCTPGALQAYVYKDGTFEYNHCKICGCVTHYRRINTNNNERICRQLSNDGAGRCGLDQSRDARRPEKAGRGLIRITRRQASKRTRVFLTHGRGLIRQREGWISSRDTWAGYATPPRSRVPPCPNAPREGRVFAHHDSRPQSYSSRATPFPGFGNRTNTSGSCPGMINRGLVASCFIRSCAARFDLASSVAVIGTCLSRFSYR